MSIGSGPLADIDDIARYLESRSPSGARNVLRAIYDSIRAIAEQPHASVRTSDPEIRIKIEPRYRYKIFYRTVGRDMIQIVHIRHRSRRLWAAGR